MGSDLTMRQPEEFEPGMPRGGLQQVEQRFRDADLFPRLNAPGEAVARCGTPPGSLREGWGSWGGEFPTHQIPSSHRVARKLPSWRMLWRFFQGSIGAEVDAIKIGLDRARVAAQEKFPVTEQVADCKGFVEQAQKRLVKLEGERDSCPVGGVSSSPSREISSGQCRRRKSVWTQLPSSAINQI